MNSGGSVTVTKTSVASPWLEFSIWRRSSNSSCERTIEGGSAIRTNFLNGDLYVSGYGVNFSIRGAFWSATANPKISISTDNINWTDVTSDLIADSPISWISWRLKEDLPPDYYIVRFQNNDAVSYLFSGIEFISPIDCPKCIDSGNPYQNEKLWGNVGIGSGDLVVTNEGKTLCDVKNQGCGRTTSWHVAYQGADILGIGTDQQPIPFNYFIGHGANNWAGSHYELNNVCYVYKYQPTFTYNDGVTSYTVQVASEAIRMIQIQQPGEYEIFAKWTRSSAGTTGPGDIVLWVNNVPRAEDLKHSRDFSSQIMHKKIYLNKGDTLFVTFSTYATGRHLDGTKETSFIGYRRSS